MKTADFSTVYFELNFVHYSAHSEYLDYTNS